MSEKHEKYKSGFVQACHDYENGMSVRDMKKKVWQVDTLPERQGYCDFMKKVESNQD